MLGLIRAGSRRLGCRFNIYRNFGFDGLKSRFQRLEKQIVCLGYFLYVLQEFV